MSQSPALPSTRRWWLDVFRPVVSYALVIVLLPLSLLLMLLGLLINKRHGGEIHKERMVGQGGKTFLLLTLNIPSGAFGARLNRSLWSLAIIRGDLAWLGHKPVVRGAYNDTVHASLAEAKPGLFGPWWIRERTNLSVGSSEEADHLYVSNITLRSELSLLPKILVAGLYGKNRADYLSQVNILGLMINNVTQDQAIEWIFELVQGSTARQLAFVNPHCVNISLKDRVYRDAILASDLVLPDGIGIQMAGRMMRTPLKQNVNGTDLFPALCQHSAAAGLSIYLLGGEPGVAERVARWLAENAPAVTVAGYRDGFFSPVEEPEVIAGINASGANLLLVAMGVPRQDVWIRQHLPALKVGVAMGVGGLFDFYSDRIARAPLWAREAGLEWIYRLSNEFGRMWRRYLIGNIEFLVKVSRFSGKRSRVLLDMLYGDDPVLRLEAATRASAETAAIDMNRATADFSCSRRAVIIASSAQGVDVGINRGRPLCMMPLNGVPMLQHVLESLVTVGVQQVDVILCDHPQIVESYFGDGSRWGVSIRYHLAQDENFPFKRLKVIKFGTDHDMVWLVDAHALPAMPWLSPESARSYVPLAGLNSTDETVSGYFFPCRSAPSGHHGWLLLPVRQLRQIAVDAALADGLGSIAAELRGPVCDLGGYGVYLSSAQDLLEAQRRILEGALRLVSHGALVEPGVQVSRNVEIHPGARIFAPVIIGEDVRIERGATIGPYAVIGSGTVIAQDTQVVDSIIERDTYIGDALSVRSCIVRHQHVYSFQHGVSVDVADSHLLNTVSLDVAARRVRLQTRVLAIILWLLTCIPMQALRLYLGKRCRRSTRLLLQTPCVDAQDQWRETSLPFYQVALWGDVPRYGWQHYFSLVFPALWRVAMGQVAIIGMPVRSRECMQLLDIESRQLALAHCAGLIDECFIRAGLAMATASSRSAIEHAYCAQASAGYDRKLFLRYLAQIIAPIPQTNRERYE